MIEGMGLKMSFGEVIEICWRWVLYPKIFPLIFLKTLQEKSPSGSRLLKSGSSPKAVNLKLGFCVASRSLHPNGLKFSHMSQYVHKVIHVKFQALQRKFGQSIAQRVQKSTVLGQKSTVTYKQSNFKIFCQHSHF